MRPVLFNLTASVFLAAGTCVTTSSFAQEEIPIVWETIVDGYHMSYGYRVVVDEDGNSYIAASAYDTVTKLDIIVVKLSPDGVILWDKEIAGSSFDFATGIALDPAGDVFISGWTDSNDYPVINAYKSVRTHRDAIITKLSGDTGEILLSTFFGGSFADHGGDIEINSNGEIYLLGYTESLDFPVTEDALQSELNILFSLTSDITLTKLSPDTSEILYSTYLGGVGDDQGINIGLDSENNIYLSGHTTSDDFPLANEIQGSNAGGFEDLIAARISADGTTLDYSTYLGGSDWDRNTGMVVDADGYAYITGWTRSVNYPTTAGAFQPDFQSEINGCGGGPFQPEYNCEDAFVTKIRPDGSDLEYSTYVGGTHVDKGSDIALDSNGDIILIGYTDSEDFPLGESGVGPTIFLSRLNSDGSDLFNTYRISSGAPQSGHGVVLDHAGDIIMTGGFSVPSEIYVAKIASGASLAMLNGFEIVSGMLLDGELQDLFNSDDTYVHTRSGFGQTVVDLHNMEMLVSAITTVDTANSLSLMIESRIDEPSGLAQIRLRNWNTNELDSVGQYSIGNTDQIDLLEDIDALDYVDGAGNIELSVKHLVFVPFLAFTFESYIDQVEISVR